MPGFLVIVRRMIESHSIHDETGFKQSVEAIIRELSVANRQGEAKILRDALASIKPNGNGSFQTINLSAKSAEPLISRLQATVTRDQLFFSSDTAQSLDRILAEFRAVKELSEAGLRPKSKLLFWGPPGCGKTVTARFMATELGLPFGIVRLSSLITSYVGETAANLQRIFSQANSSSMVLLFDEADAIAKNREDRNDVGELKRVVNSLLQNLDELVPAQSIVILASNHQHLFDSAVWRRFDDVIEFPLPNYTERLAQLTRLTSGVSIKGSLAQAAKDLRDFSFADIERSVTEVLKTMVLNRNEFFNTLDLITESRSWHHKQKQALSNNRG